MLEALACGTPVVATATAGAVEAQGFFEEDLQLTPLEDAEALAAAVQRALGTPRRVSPRTHARIASTFTPAACAQAYREVYAGALHTFARRHH
jgi:glycosyltransferase involved in cell wall biosynthesis